MLIQNIFYLPVLASLLAITLFIFSRNIRSWINVFFGFFTAFTMLWLFGLYQADTSTTAADALFWTRFGVFFSCFLTYFFLLFSKVFPEDKRPKGLSATLFLLPVAILALYTFTDSMVSEVKLGQYVSEPTKVGTAYTVYLAFIASYFLVAFVTLVRKLKKATTAQKSQIKFVLAGTIFGVLVNIVFNIVFVILGISGIGLLLGGPSVLVFTLLVTFAIVRHRLFDIRLVLARSVGYLLSVLSLGGLFSLISFLLVNNVITGSSELNQVQTISFTFIAVLLAFIFQPTKRFFDKITNSLFYRDAYDAQILLNDFNQALVSTIDLSKLLKGAATTVEKYIKPDFCDFAVHDSKSDTTRIISGGKAKIDDGLVQQFRKYTRNSSKKLFVADALDDSSAELKTVLEKGGVGLVARINSESHNEGIGYIVLGYKKSGNMYSAQDAAVMEILANELAIAIQNALSFEEIKQFNITLQEKVDDATRRLRSTNEKLRQLDETKDEFISMASHQLRTPLTSVKGYISMVMEGDTGKITAAQRKLLDQAFISSQRMVYLIADLLNVSRLRTGKFVIEAKPTNLAELVAGEIGQLKETAAGRKLDLTYEKPIKFPELMLDETKIRQVVMNFVDNAIYYTPAGGHIKVKVNETPEAIEFTVTDDGLGVPKSEQHHLFGKFYRAGNAKKARPDGTGLGLFMAKKVIIAQGGSIIFSSTEGKGSTFGFHFSKSKLAVPAHIQAQN